MANEITIRCVIYAAKSTEDRRGSIPEQLHECRSAVFRGCGRSLDAEYVDESFSAFSGDRGPGLLEAMRRVEDLAGEHGGAELWAQHSDRLARGDGRSARHAVEIALWAMKRGIAVRTLQDPDTFRDLLYAVVIGQRNHEDSRRKSFSVTAGRKRAAERGEHLGYRPDGYMFVADVDPKGSITKRLEIDPAREPVIREIFRLALTGKQPGLHRREQQVPRPGQRPALGSIHHASGWLALLGDRAGRRRMRARRVASESPRTDRVHLGLAAPGPNVQLLG
jgi:DNA invertase Pin-like site-specific DNA recombinase